jgi:hypothetical protein
MTAFAESKGTQKGRHPQPMTAFKFVGKFVGLKLTNMQVESQSAARSLAAAPGEESRCFQNCASISQGAAAKDHAGTGANQ